MYLCIYMGEIWIILYNFSCPQFYKPHGLHCIFRYFQINWLDASIMILRNKKINKNSKKIYLQIPFIKCKFYKHVIFNIYLDQFEIEAKLCYPCSFHLTAKFHLTAPTIFAPRGFVLLCPIRNDM